MSGARFARSVGDDLIRLRIDLKIGKKRKLPIMRRGYRSSTSRVS